MKLRNLFALNTIVALVFAAGLLFAPKTLLDLFGLNVGAGVSNSAKINLVTQLLGAALIVPGMISWFGRDITDAGARRSIALSLFVFDTIGLLVSLFVGMLPKVMATTGWSIVGLFLILALGYAYFLFMKQSEI
jgi:hypothetical protein